MSPHSALGIAQIIFYVPVVPLALWLMRRNGGIHPRMAWWPLIPFSLIRLAGGPLVIMLHRDPTNIALATVAMIFLNIGVMPLLVAASGFLRIVIIDNPKIIDHSLLMQKYLRLSNIIAIALLSAGGGLGSQPENPLRSIGRALSFAGYGIFTVELVSIVAAATHLTRYYRVLLSSSRNALVALFLASPFLLVRTIYAFIQVANQHNVFSRWNPLYGSAALFAVMALLMEYVCLVTFVSTGFSIAPSRGVPPTLEIECEA
ncbi:hypothetical protein NLU13_2456 [Sarocladium strictum]|uniref:DUF7702 domain-containing protein n=1 Tax=Sarocladium strictum TaxID=5046 RepID=A0AA39GSW4_SARSR|nr:hypothetical protein NLU13_2456 [Sarocladium strictum]